MFLVVIAVGGYATWYVASPVSISRLPAEVEIPLGILTAVVGAPFFIWLLASMQRSWS